MSGLDQAPSGLASGQLQAIVAAAQSKLQAVPATGSTSASAAVDVAVHDTKILFPPVFPMLPDMSDGHFPYPDSAIARAEPGLGWLTDITPRYLFKRSLYIWKQKRAGATSTGQTVSLWETTPLSFSNWQGLMQTKVSVFLRCGVTMDWEPWLLAGSIPTANHMGPSSGLKTKMRSTLIGMQWRERSSHRPQCARGGVPFRLAGTRSGCTA